MTELIYADDEVKDLIHRRFPGAIFENASDNIHPDRFNVILDCVTEDEFYPFAINHSFARECLGFELILRSGKNADKIHRWLALSKETYEYEV